MKKIKNTSLILLLCVMLGALACLTGCHCEPASVEWRLQNYLVDYEFVGGVHRRIGFATASVPFPFVSADFENTYIRFTEDGEIEFSTNEGERLYGTYTWENVGNYTTFHATFTNGEVLDGDAMSSIDGDKLAFTFRGITYAFGTEVYEQTSMDDIIEQVRTGNASGLYEATVARTEDGYSILYPDDYTYTVSEETAIYAVRINSDGSYEELHELTEGAVLSTYNETVNYIVIYYLDSASE